ncbi:MAG TPA: hypothetical protein VNH18_31860 [Bryobacteraceae bacterium]|nr:hypothetical protein [Bryobacteraceae bacterium]
MLKIGSLILIAASLSPGQNIVPAQAQEQNTHLFWLIPNYRTSVGLHPNKRLTVQEEFKVAGEDSWDRGTLALAALFAGGGPTYQFEPTIRPGCGGLRPLLGNI